MTGCSEASRPTGIPTPSGLEAALQQYQLEPHPAFGRYAAAGAAFPVGERRVPLPPSEVYATTDGLLAPAPDSEMGMEARYEDKVHLKSGIGVTLLKFLGLSLEADAESLDRVHSNVVNLKPRDVLRPAFARAVLKPEFAQQLGPAHAFVGVCSTGTAESLKLELYRKQGAGGSVQVPFKALTGELNGRYERTADADQTFKNFLFASKPIVRVGGPGSSVDPEIASRIHSKFKETAPDAAIFGPNTVVASASWTQAFTLAELGESIAREAAAQRANNALEQAKAVAIEERDSALAKVANIEREKKHLEERLARVLPANEDRMLANNGIVIAEHASLKAERDLFAKMLLEQQRRLAAIKSDLDMAVAALNRASERLPQQFVAEIKDTTRMIERASSKIDP